jgi:LysR family glycine cleavage system transcriptional activator
MMRTATLLPTLPALRAFEAAGRLMSFRRAGEELLVSQSAVSHHIATLERELGVKLFDRGPRGVTFTLAGERYFVMVRDAFKLIAAGTADLRGSASRARVRVSVLPSFAANWLVPRLAGLNERHPDIDFALDPTLRLADLDAGEADLAIRYGDGRWPGVESRLLMSERLTPVASPDLLRAGPVINEPKDLLNHTLLLVSRPYEWEVWANASDLDLGRARTIQLSDYNIVLQAALDGQGIAVGRLLLVGDRLRTGALAQPCPGVVTSPRVGHWLVTPKHRQPSQAAAAVMGWLLKEGSDANAGSSTGAGA